MFLLSGKEVQEVLKKELKEKVGALSSSPKLIILQIGDNEQSNIYIKRKKKFGEEIGVIVEHKKFEENISEEKVIKEIETQNQDKTVDGIIVQLPIPKNIDLSRVLNSICIKKDVDGLGAGQIGLLYSGNNNAIVPATARGVISLLDFYKIDLESKNVVIVGRSNLVGKPLAQVCLKRNATVTLCHSKTKNLKNYTKMADIIIVACGIPNLINSSFLSENQVVIDVGINKIDSGLCGDVDFKDVSEKVLSITPVPGGVGPLTVVSLFQNLIDAK